MKRTILSRTNLFTTAAAIILVLSAADSSATNIAASPKAPKAKAGSLVIATAADVGGVAIEPGDYDVKQVNSPAGPVIRFTRVTYNPHAQEALPFYDWEKVAEIKVTLQPLNSRAAYTELKFAPYGNKALALQVRGNAFDYLF